MIVGALLNKKNLPVKNHSIFIDVDNNIILFQSYNSIICKIDYKKNVIYFGEDWDYSITTKKYLYKFLRDNGFNINSSSQIKKCILTGYLECTTTFKLFKCFYTKNI